MTGFNYREIAERARDRDAALRRFVVFFVDTPKITHLNVHELATVRLVEILHEYPSLPTAFTRTLNESIIRIIKDMRANSILGGGDDGYYLEEKAFFLFQDLDENSEAPSVDVGLGRIEQEWSPLPLERDEASLNDAIQKTEILVEQVRSDNGFSVAEPYKRDSIVWSLSSGIESLKKRFPTREQIEALLLRPIKYLSEKFSSAAIGELAKEALKAVVKLLGIGA